MSRESVCLVGYWVRKLKSGPGPSRVDPWDQQNSSIFSVLFEGICQLAAKQSIGQQFSKLTYHKYFALIERIAQ